MSRLNLVQLVVTTLIVVLSLVILGVDIKLIDENRLWLHHGVFPVLDVSITAESLIHVLIITR